MKRKAWILTVLLVLVSASAGATLFTAEDLHGGHLEYGEPAIGMSYQGYIPVGYDAEIFEPLPEDWERLLTVRIAGGSYTVRLPEGMDATDPAMYYKAIRFVVDGEDSLRIDPVQDFPYLDVSSLEIVGDVIYGEFVDIGEDAAVFTGYYLSLEQDGSTQDFTLKITDDTYVPSGMVLGQTYDLMIDSDTMEIFVVAVSNG